MYDIEKYKKKLHYFDRKFIRKIQAIFINCRSYISDMIPNRRLSQKSSFTTFLLIVAVSVILSFSGISINLTNNINAQAQAQEQQQVEQTQVNKLWETPANLKDPESVAYESKQQVLFVSNINGQPDQKDQNGFISKVSPSNGSIIELNWITTLNAPKGIAISNDNSTL